MLKLASLVYDVYTDVHKSTLQKIAGAMPDFVRDSELLTDDQLENLSDSDFALIITTRDGETLRLFPIINAAHTWLAVKYFNEHNSKLPEAARKIAATNIMEAAKYWEIVYKIDVDQKDFDDLKRYASEQDMTTRDYKLEEGESKPSIPTSYEKKANILMQSNRHYYETLNDAESIVKQAEATAMIKTAASDDCCYALVVNNADGSKDRFLRIDSPENFKEAQVQFDKQLNDIDPRYRTKIACKIRAISNTLRWPIESENIERYAPLEFNEKVAFNLNKRRDYIKSEENVTVLDLMIKNASKNWSPFEFAEDLTKFDCANNLDKFWGVAFPDPYASIGGLDKVAMVDGYDITEEELMALANDPNRLKGVLDESMLKDFATNPVEFFGALPKPHQKMLVGIIKGEM